MAALNLLPKYNSVASNAFYASEAIGCAESDPSGKEAVPSRKAKRHSLVLNSINLEKADTLMGQSWGNSLAFCS